MTTALFGYHQCDLSTGDPFRDALMPRGHGDRARCRICGTAWSWDSAQGWVQLSPRRIAGAERRELDPRRPTLIMRAVACLFDMVAHRERGIHKALRDGTEAPHQVLTPAMLQEAFYQLERGPHGLYQSSAEVGPT